MLITAPPAKAKRSENEGTTEMSEQAKKTVATEFHPHMQPVNWGAIADRYDAAQKRLAAKRAADEARS
jgi:hypothetical protein